MTLDQLDIYLEQGGTVESKDVREAMLAITTELKILRANERVLRTNEQVLKGNDEVLRQGIAELMARVAALEHALSSARER